MYNFKRYKSNGSGCKYCGLSIGKNIVTISKQFSDMLNCERIMIHFDKDDKSIMVTPTKSFRQTYSIKRKNNGSKMFNCRIYKIMPIGRYYFKETSNNGFVCILDNI